MPSLALACRLSAAQAPQPLPRRVRNILSKYQATALIPGEPILGPELGPEVVTPINLLDASKWDNTHTSSVSANSWSVGSSGGPMLITTPGKTYSVSFPWSSTASGAFALYNGNNPSAPLVLQQTGSSGVLSCVFTAVSTRAYFRIAVGATVTVGVAISVREILGYTNTYSTFVSGNYVESTGQTLSPVDRDVGLVVDAAGSAGPELIPDGSFASGVGEWSEMAEPSSSVIDGELVVTRTTGFVGRQRTFSAVANKTYVIEGDVTRSSGTGVPVLRVRTGSALSGVILADGIITAPPAATMQRYRVVFQSTVTGVLYAQVAINTSSAVCRFDNISVRELPGIHATQPTTQYKPVLRRGLVNLLTYSADFSNAVWSAQGGAVKTNSTTVSLPVANGRVTQAGPVGSSSPGRVWTSAWLLSGTGTISLFMYDDGGAYPGNSSRQITLTDTPTLYLHTRTHSDATATKVAAQVTTASGGVTLVSGGAALFQGTVTAEQILAGGIPVTTTAPASSAIGPQYWQFDGTEDRWSLSAVPFQMSDDFVIVAGIKPTLVDGPARRIFSASGAGTALVEFYVSATNGVASLRVRDDAGVDTFTGLGTPNLLNRVLVATARKVGNLKSLRLDGVLNGTSSVTTGAGNIASSTIGSTTSGSSPFAGENHAVILIKGNPTDAELLTLERFVATLQGRRI